MTTIEEELERYKNRFSLYKSSFDELGVGDTVVYYSYKKVELRMVEKATCFSFYVAGIEFSRDNGDPFTDSYANRHRCIYPPNFVINNITGRTALDRYLDYVPNP